MLRAAIVFGAGSQFWKMFGRKTVFKPDRPRRKVLHFSGKHIISITRLICRDIYKHIQSAEAASARQEFWPPSIRITWTVRVRARSVDIEGNEIVIAAGGRIGWHGAIAGSIDQALPGAELPVGIAGIAS